MPRDLQHMHDTPETVGIRPVPEVIARIEQGFTCHWQISARGPLMRSHAQAGNTERAEEYAREITEIQRASGVRVHDDARFIMGLECWANIVTHGVLVPRAIPNSETEAEALHKVRQYRSCFEASVIDRVPQAYQVAAQQGVA